MSSENCTQKTTSEIVVLWDSVGNEMKCYSLRFCFSRTKEQTLDIEHLLGEKVEFVYV